MLTIGEDPILDADGVKATAVTCLIPLEVFCLTCSGFANSTHYLQSVWLWLQRVFTLRSAKATLPEANVRALKVNCVDFEETCQDRGTREEQPSARKGT